MKILVINAGSSSLKYQLIDMTTKDVLAKGLCERIGIEGSNLKHKPQNKDAVIISSYMNDHSDAIKMVIDAILDKNHGVIQSMDEISAVGHRVVHGGEAFTGSVIIDDDVKKALDQCTELAPLHNPPNIIGINACEKAMPGIPNIAVFDTAFHQTIPPQGYLYAIPYRLYEKYKIRKYGFHGTSHKYVSQRASQMLNRPIEDLKLITCHLGNGSSITAVKSGKSVDTSMGFTPLDGVVMGTRTGNFDPAVVFYIMEKENLTPKQVNDLLNKKSGVLGVSGISSDFRDLMDCSAKGEQQASLALDMFIYSVKKYIGEYAAIMGGVDAVIFTAGIGENNFIIREKIVKDMEFLGISIDSEKNKISGIEADVSADGAKTRVLVVPTNEELMIALEAQKIIEK